MRLGCSAAMILVGTFLVSCSRSNSNQLVARWNPTTNTVVPTGLALASTGGVRLASSARGTAWDFDGKKAALIAADSPKLHFSGRQNFSITAWIQSQPNNNSFGVSSIVEKRQVSGIAAALGFSLHLEYGFLSCQLAPTPPMRWHFSDFTSLGRFKAAWAGRTAPGSVFRFVSNKAMVSDGKFHHVALTMDRGSTNGGKLFVDGVVVKTFDPTKVPGNLSNHQPLIIGNHPDTTLTCGFTGRIAEVSIFRKALCEQEVSQAANEN